MRPSWKSYAATPSEAGVRNLEREIANFFRKIGSGKLVKAGKKRGNSSHLDAQDVRKYLGIAKYQIWS